MEEEEKSRVRSSHLSLDFPAIRLANVGEAINKVAPHDKDYVWVPVLRRFDKLRKGRGFSSTYFTFCLRSM